MSQEAPLKVFKYITADGIELPEVTDKDYLQVLIYPGKAIRAKAIPLVVEDIQFKPILNQIALMVNTMYVHNGIGLASTQVGIPWSIIVWDTEWYKKDGTQRPNVLINPKIIEADGSVEFEEGCLSVPLDFKYKVTRFEDIVIEGLNLKGECVKFAFSGLDAICAQHEIDHLAGKLFIDHLSRLKQDIYHRKVMKQIRKYKRGYQLGEQIN